MLVLQNTNDATIASLSMTDKPIENLLNKEWLLTNSRGGYASSTVVGCNTRRYHGLLIGSLNPPANRIIALANCMEMLVFKGKAFNLSTFEFNDKFVPAGFSHIKRFRQDIGAHFDYESDLFELTKSVYLDYYSDTAAIVYDFTDVRESAEFVLRPFIGLRDFHSLQKSYSHFSSDRLGQSLRISHDMMENCELLLSCPSANFEKDEQWWFNFIYRKDRQRGQDFSEDLWTPGYFKCQIDSPAKIVFWARLTSRLKPQQLIDGDIEALKRDLKSHRNIVTSAVKGRDEKLRTLYVAADQFISRRQTVDNDHRFTILAGYPWFADWGRDAFIALPGLLLSTRRFEEAGSVLTTFSQAADEGVIPNRFDDRSDTAYFNSIDASLWFINSAFQYLSASGDSETFTQQLLPTIRCIVDSFHDGTKFDTHADSDGLITAGNQATQLTWMDAKYNGVAFTPRYGKAVEINALWYNSLCWLAQYYTDMDIEAAEHYHFMADEVESSFCKLFWNNSAGYLNDCILPDGSIDATIRPNQIIAVSLPFSPLPLPQQKAVVDTVQKKLLTPFGLRTLNTSDSRYKGTYTGPQQQRDQAYHQGTVWPWLMGPFVESYLKVNDFSRESKTKAAEFIAPLLRHLTEDACLGQISEIFDGDSPHEPRGCIAQAWSVAELIRAYQLINQ